MRPPAIQAERPATMHEFNRVMTASMRPPAIQAERMEDGEPVIVAVELQ